MMSGIGAAQARIAEIQGHLQSLSAPSAGGVVGNAAAAAAAPARFDQLMAEAAPQGTPQATPASAAAPATRSAQSAGANRQAVPAGITPGDWASRLPAEGQQWAGAIEQAATRHGVDPALLGALVWAESGFKADAVSHAGALGLAQLMPATAAGMDVDPHDPAQNLDGGARFLKAQLDRFGSADLALAAYNAGPGRVAQAGGIPQIAETQAYVPKVLGHLAHLKGTA